MTTNPRSAIGTETTLMGIAPSLAAAIYDAQMIQSRCEDVILGAIRGFFKRGDASFKRFDYYDTSIEFWAKPGTELTEEEQAVLWVLGFCRCWVCYREVDDGPSVGEKYYWGGKTPR